MASLLGEEKLLSAFRRGRLMHYDKGEVILHADDEPAGIYLIAKGFVKVYSLTNRGEEKLHIIYKPGELFPLIWVFRGLRRSVFYEAMEPTSLYCVRREVFLKLTNQDSEVAAAVMKRVVTAFRVYADRIDNLELTSAYHRVVYRLLFLADRFGVQGEDGVFIRAPIGHHDIANSINTARETTSRQIEKLERKGLVRHRGRLIVIPDPERLRRELPL